MAILGAGLTGLWTAYELQRRVPGLRIVILERDIAGFGASGRNGSWCTPDLNISLPMLARRFGTSAAQATQQATYDAVDEVGRVCARGGPGRRLRARRVALRGPWRAAAARPAGKLRDLRALRLRRSLRAAGRGPGQGARRHRGDGGRPGHGRLGGDPSGPSRAQPGAPGGAARGDDPRAHGRDGVCRPRRGPRLARPRGPAHRPRHGPGRHDRAGRGGLPDRPAPPAPPAHPGLLADRAHGTAQRRAVGRHRLAGAPVRRVVPPQHRLPGPDGGRPHPLRGPRRAVPLRLGHQAALRPPPADPRHAAGHGPGVVPGAP